MPPDRTTSPGDEAVKVPSLLSDDEVFENAEHFAVAAARDPRLIPIHLHFHTLALGREHQGWKKGPLGMNQNQKLLKQMRDGRTVTRLTAIMGGVMNLTARISDLRALGHDVICTMKTDPEGREYGVFSLAPPISPEA